MFYLIICKNIERGQEWGRVLNGAKRLGVGGYIRLVYKSDKRKKIRNSIHYKVAWDKSFLKVLIMQVVKTIKQIKNDNFIWENFV